jgi:hypothetical protein
MSFSMTITQKWEESNIARVKRLDYKTLPSFIPEISKSFREGALTGLTAEIHVTSPWRSGPVPA